MTKISATLAFAIFLSCPFGSNAFASSYDQEIRLKVMDFGTTTLGASGTGVLTETGGRGALILPVAKIRDGNVLAAWRNAVERLRIRGISSDGDVARRLGFPDTVVSLGKVPGVPVKWKTPVPKFDLKNLDFKFKGLNFPVAGTYRLVNPSVEAEITRLRREMNGLASLTAKLRSSELAALASESRALCSGLDAAGIDLGHMIRYFADIHLLKNSKTLADIKPFAAPLDATKRGNLRDYLRGVEKLFFKTDSPSGVVGLMTDHELEVAAECLVAASKEAHLRVQYRRPDISYVTHFMMPRSPNDRVLLPALLALESRHLGSAEHFSVQAPPGKDFLAFADQTRAGLKNYLTHLKKTKLYSRFDRTYLSRVIQKEKSVATMDQAVDALLKDLKVLSRSLISRFERWEWRCHGQYCGDDFA